MGISMTIPATFFAGIRLAHLVCVVFRVQDVIGGIGIPLRVCALVCLITDVLAFWFDGRPTGIV